MPQLYSAILHTSTPIYSIHTDSIQKSIYTRRLEGEIWIDSSYNIISVDSNKSLPLDIYKYFPKNAGIPIQNSYIFADGIFIVKKIDNSLSFQLRALHISQYGNPNDEDYIAKCPQPQSSTLNIIGVVGKTFDVHSDIKDYNPRSFELNTSIFDTRESPALYTVMCFIPQDTRFQNTPLPTSRAPVSIFGIIIGIHTPSNNIALLLSDIVFLSARNAIDFCDTTTDEGLQDPESSSPKRKWDKWRKNTGVEQKSKRVKVSSVNIPSSSPMSSIIVSSEQTNSTLVGEKNTSTMSNISVP
ncbi:hypothetical protein BDZ91DRAFT_708705 [Kalaharituber pfeilii]|nr:hypothetical protein BDZ91DRAFT_708705 [Kalaharituber pfeilii]